jgi:hypothetical protein
VLGTLGHTIVYWVHIKSFTCIAQLQQRWDNIITSFPLSQCATVSNFNMFNLFHNCNVTGILWNFFNSVLCPSLINVLNLSRELLVCHCVNCNTYDSSQWEHPHYTWCVMITLLNYAITSCAKQISYACFSSTTYIQHTTVWQQCYFENSKFHSLIRFYCYF